MHTCTSESLLQFSFRIKGKKNSMSYPNFFEAQGIFSTCSRSYIRTKHIQAHLSKAHGFIAKGFLTPLFLYGSITTPTERRRSSDKPQTRRDGKAQFEIWGKDVLGYQERWVSPIDLNHFLQHIQCNICALSQLLPTYWAVSISLNLLFRHTYSDKPALLVALMVSVVTLVKWVNGTPPLNWLLYTLL